MPLTTDQLEKIAIDLINGKEPRVTGPDADTFRKELAKDLELARQKGWVVEIPFEVLRSE